MYVILVSLIKGMNTNKFWILRKVSPVPTVLNFGFGSQTIVLNFGLGSRTRVFIFGLGSLTIVLNF